MSQNIAYGFSVFRIYRSIKFLDLMALTAKANDSVIRCFKFRKEASSQLSLGNFRSSSLLYKSCNCYSYLNNGGLFGYNFPYLLGRRSVLVILFELYRHVSLPPTSSDPRFKEKVWTSSQISSAQSAYDPGYPLFSTRFSPLVHLASSIQRIYFAVQF